MLQTKVIVGPEILNMQFTIHISRSVVKTSWNNAKMATQALLNNIQLSLDTKRLVGGIFCDLQKAFDCVNQNILLEKMKYYRITGTAYKLMQFIHSFIYFTFH